jgi:methionyl aminopeptidase
MSGIPIKSSAEIARMRIAGKCAARILKFLSGMVAPGVSTGEIDAAAAEKIREEGCTSAFLGYVVHGRPFPGHICISVNEEVVHGIGGGRRIRYGDIVKIDVGVIKDGWIGDTATTVPAGAIDPKWLKLLQVTQLALEVAIKHARNGVRLGDLCASIENEVTVNGYSVVRDFVGHGVGRKLHEEPQIPNFGRRGTGPKLRPGMTLAIEPMVNMGAPAVRTLADQWTIVTADGSPSAHFEHTVLITEGEPEILTWREMTS